MPAKHHDYDVTKARRQAKRRALFNRMRAALRAVLEAKTLDEAHERASDGLDESLSEKDDD